MQRFELQSGLTYYPEALDKTEQQAILTELRDLMRQAPLYHPIMPRTGHKMSVASTNCGSWGWTSDRENGYRYQRTHPVTQKIWPPLPQSFLNLWHQFSGFEDSPDCGLINYYNAEAKMALHIDKDELNFAAPILSLSLGDQAYFKIGGLSRKDKSQKLKLSSGDIIIMSGASRKIYHGISKILPASSTLIKEGGRFNVTLRKVK